MRRHFLLLLIGIVLSTGWTYADNGLTVADINEGGISMSYRPLATGIDTVTTDDKSFVIYEYRDHALGEAPGHPMIPVTSILFATPQGAEPSVDFSVSGTENRANVDLAPVPVFESDESGIDNEVYREDPYAYALSGFMPERSWRLEKTRDFSGLSIWQLTLYPLRYDAHAKTATLLNGADIRISYNAYAAKMSDIRRLPESIVNRAIFTDTEPGARKAAQDALPNPFGSGNWYRIILNETGMYSMSGADLKKAGFPVDITKSNAVRMYYGGGRMLDPDDDTGIDRFREIAIEVNDGGDGMFNTNDTIVFYGTALNRFVLTNVTRPPVYHNHLYDEENVYWITISNDGTPKRIQSDNATPSSSQESKKTFRERIHIETESHPYFEESGDHWYWDDIARATKSYAFNATDIANSDSSLIRITYMNLHHDTQKSQHSMNTWINDEGPFNNFFSQTILNYTVKIHPEAPLKDKNNIVSLSRTNGLEDNSARLDWMEIEYERSLRKSSPVLEFFVLGTGMPQQWSISYVSSSEERIFDTTDPYNVMELSGADFDTTRKTLSFSRMIAENNYHRFTVTNHSAYKSPLAISRKQQTGLALRNTNHDATHIIITHPLFKSEADRLAAWRSNDSQKDPLTSLVVNVEDIYDEFSWGVFDPQAIRNYLEYAWQNYTSELKYCCLFGDTIWKYRDLTESQKNQLMVPTYYYYDSQGLTPADDYFTWFMADRIPEISIGRLCVNDIETARIIVDKIIDYEKTTDEGLWQNRILLISDDEKNNSVVSETEFTRDSEILANGDSTGTIFIPENMEVTKLYEIEYPFKNNKKPDVTEDLMKYVNNGYLMMNFLGHGNNELIAHEHILVGSRDIERFNNGLRQPLFFVGSCSVGHYDLMDTITLAEQLHQRKDGGCIAVVAGARNTYHESNFTFTKSFYRHMFFENGNNPEFRIGRAVQSAKQTVNRFNSIRYELFGDPATRLKVAHNTFNIAQVDSVYRLQKLDLSGNVSNGEGAIPFDGKLYIKAQGPQQNKEYVTLKQDTIQYTLPGKTFYQGILDISGDSFDASLVVPKDISSDGEKPIVYLFAQGDGPEARGALTGFSIGGLYKDAPADGTGPELNVYFDGVKYEEGNYIRRQPVMTVRANDPSGINTYGNRGHNITLMIDDAELVILTDSFMYENSYTAGSLEYQFPYLTPGEHTFEIGVYDSYNNLAQKRITTSVIGSESGDVSIEKLLNYPNPMGTDGTTFTFILNDDARKAEIKVYTQAGRLVDKFTFNAAFGYNTAFWKPDLTLANGVYFYKLKVWSLNGREATKIEKLVVMR